MATVKKKTVTKKKPAANKNGGVGKVKASPGYKSSAKKPSARRK